MDKEEIAGIILILALFGALAVWMVLFMMGYR